ncbi:hypothetical protein, partial [Streptomyces chiangmaiensis]|nr:indole-3-glycerol-phosphate synthase TrpC [Streptomyces chiangmaiensis]
MYLDDILAHKRSAWRDSTAVVDGVPETRPTPAKPGSLATALRRDTVAVIAEVKPKSPSKGDLWP